MFGLVYLVQNKNNVFNNYLLILSNNKGNKTLKLSIKYLWSDAK